MELLKKAALKIKNLEIQGATNIAVFGVKQLTEFAKRNTHYPQDKLWRLLLEAEKILSSARSTEPALRNGLMFILGKIRQKKQEILKENPDMDESKIKLDIPALVERYGTKYEEILKDAKKKIAKFGANLIPKNADHFVVQTHCHSSVVEAILIEAHKQGKEFEVISTETRPFYQGRITARKLLEAGIKVTQVVDSAMRWAARNLNSDIILIGADAVTSEGTVLNKIGSRLLALVAHEEHIPLYVATPLLKYNPGTAFGNFEKIEMRDVSEITKDWENPPKGLKLLNPAFETVNRLYINGLVTEAGIFPSGEVHSTFRHYYRFLHDAYYYIEAEEKKL